MPKSEDLIAAKACAEILVGKIKEGIEKIKKHIQERDSITRCFSGRAPSVCNAEPQQQHDQHASYHDILRSFVVDAQYHIDKSEASRLLSWFSRFSAGTVDMIMDRLPARDSQVVNNKGPLDRVAKKRDRDFARLVNSVAFQLPRVPCIVYVALAGKFPDRSPYGTADNRSCEL